MLSATFRNYLPLLLGVALAFAWTQAQAQRVCTTNGNGATWNTVANWNCTGGTNNGPPASGADSAVIAHNTTYNTTGITVTALTIDAARTLTYGTGAVRTLSVSGNLLVNGTFTVADDGTNRAHLLNVAGDLTNNGAIDFAVAGDTVGLNFTKPGTAGADIQTVSGNGTWDYFLVTVNMGNNKLVDYVDWTATAAMPVAPRLVLIQGTFRFNNGLTWTPFNVDPVIPNAAGFWVASGTVSHTAATFTVAGLLKISGGTMEIGNADDERLLLDLNSNFVMEGGTLNVAGRLTRQAAGEAHTFDMSGGTINIGVGVGGIGYLNFLAIGSFQLESNATFNMSGGLITVRAGSTQGATDNASAYINLASTSTVTGGTIQIGNGAAVGNNGYIVNSLPAMGNLVIDATTAVKSVRLATNNLTVLNNVTINGSGAGVGSTLASSNLNITVGTTLNASSSSWTNNGIFTAGTGTVTFQGNTAQTLAGTSQTTFNNLILNKPSGGSNVTVLTVNTSTLALSPIVSGTLTFTEGRIDTRTNTRTVILDTAALVAGTLGATRHVNGCVRKNYTNTATGFIFPTGDGTNYTPVQQTFAPNTGAVEDFTACVTAAEHPQVNAPITTTGINRLKSVNRYWTLSSTSSPFVNPFSLTFTYVSGDNDAGPPAATPANYIIQRYDSATAAWYPTAVSGTPSSTGAATVSSVTNGLGDYAIGEPIEGFSSANPGRFNAFEVGTLPNSAPTSAIIGKLFTRVAGVSSNVDIVAINPNRTALTSAPAFTGGVRIWVINAEDDTGAFVSAANTGGCRTSWKFRNGTAVAPYPGFASAGATDATATFVLGDNSRKNNVAVAFPNEAFTRARLLIVDSASDSIIGCTSDAFALRPASVELEALDGDWQSAGVTRALNNTSVSGGNVHAASTSSASPSRPFTLRATGRASGGLLATGNYKGSPTPKVGPTCVLPASGCVVGVLTPTYSVSTPWTWGTVGVNTGQRTTDLHYSEVGAFSLEVEDAGFAVVDHGDGTSAVQYTIPQLNSPTPLNIGRFVPNHFTVATNNAPKFKTFGSSCGSFTYLGQSFGYLVTALPVQNPPQVLVSARNAAGTVTSNYMGTLWKISTTAPSDVSVAYADATVGAPTLDASLAYPATASNTPTVDASAANGTGTITLNSADKLTYLRSASTPRAPYTANITVTISARDNAETGPAGNPSEITSSTPQSFSNVDFDGMAGGKEFRYGRARLVGGVGSEKVTLHTVSLQTEFYNASGIFATNTADTCSSFVSGNFSLQNHVATGGAFAAALPSSKVQGNVTVTGGVASIKISPPTAPAPPTPIPTGSAIVCLDLGADPTVPSAPAIGCSATSAGQSWLQGNWQGFANYVVDPTARIAFGVYGAQPRNFIFFRENY